MRGKQTLFALALAIAATGCPGRLENPERFLASEMSGTQDGGSPPEEACPSGIDGPSGIFATKCANAGCHVAEGSAARLDLVSAGLFDRLKDVSSPNCAGKKLVDSAAVDSSLLLEKVSSMPTCGSPMPLGTTGLSSDDYDCVKAWIVQQLGTSTSTRGSNG